MSKTNAPLIACPICDEKFREKGFPVHMAAHARRGEAAPEAKEMIIVRPATAPTNGVAHTNGAPPSYLVQQAIEGIDGQIATLQKQREVLRTAKAALDPLSGIPYEKLIIPIAMPAQLEA